MILVAGERDERQTLTNTLQKEQHLLAAYAMSPRHSRHRRVYFGQAVSGAAVPPSVSIDKCSQTSFVMLMLEAKDRDQNRGVEESSQRRRPRFRSSRSRRICSMVSSTVVADRGSPESNTQTPSSFRSCAVPRRGRSVI